MLDQTTSEHMVIVAESLDSDGITNYTMRPGNNCIWVSYGRVDCYYLFKDNKIVDIQYD
jgi:hypothetical protein